MAQVTKLLPGTTTPTRLETPQKQGNPFETSILEDTTNLPKVLSTKNLHQAQDPKEAKLANEALQQTERKEASMKQENERLSQEVVQFKSKVTELTKQIEIIKRDWETERTDSQKQIQRLKETVDLHVKKEKQLNERLSEADIKRGKSVEEKKTVNCAQDIGLDFSKYQEIIELEQTWAEKLKEHIVETHGFKFYEDKTTFACENRIQEIHEELKIVFRDTLTAISRRKCREVSERIDTRIEYFTTHLKRLEDIQAKQEAWFSASELLLSSTEISDTKRSTDLRINEIRDRITQLL